MFEYNRLDANQARDEIHIKCLYRVVSHQYTRASATLVTLSHPTPKPDYFVDNHWSKVPKSWSHCLEDFELKDIPNLLSTDSESKFKCVLPLSLLSLRATCSALQLTRKWSPDSSIIFPKSHFSESTQQLDSELKDSNHPNMKTEILNRRVKHKKRHEIRRLSKLTDHLLKGMCDCKTIVDCGSGQGHLSRILSLCFGYDVISIEGNDDNVLGAQHKDMNTLNSLKRYKLTDRLNLDFPKKVNCLLQKDSSISEVTQNSDNHLLLGLHACGPLSTIILNQLKECNSAKALLLVSCCYMKIDSNRQIVDTNEQLPQDITHEVVTCHPRNQIMAYLYW
ncbi:unnamed protein product [Oppiella nova]|uniref:Methyltransferase domain-containing protein n=1 Tax=Oppiella nova TaxID=334625 RepID=A0A7R9QVQ8_9ACAR|nr:unnamed protein product [Oppiella nova]CAG2176133.1 unnamed protein product [Oppiella nova]